MTANDEYELNKKLSEALAWREPNCKNVTFENGCYWVESTGFSSFPINNYLNDWGVLMPVALKYGVSVIKVDPDISGECYSAHSGVFDTDGYLQNPLHEYVEDKANVAVVKCLISLLSETSERPC